VARSACQAIAGGGLVGQGLGNIRVYADLENGSSLDNRFLPWKDVHTTLNITRTKVSLFAPVAGVVVPDLRSMTDSRGVLPPIRGPWPLPGSSATPFQISLADFCALTGYTNERRDILQGLIQLRVLIKQAGVTGFQWVDGSFLHHEDLYLRPPEDIDLVTWIQCKTLSQATIKRVGKRLLTKVPQIADAKVRFRTDAYWEFCTTAGLVHPERAAYWLGLFSHTSGKEGSPKGLWKGFFQIGLADDEATIHL